MRDGIQFKRYNIATVNTSIGKLTHAYWSVRDTMDYLTISRGKSDDTVEEEFGKLDARSSIFRALSW